MHLRLIILILMLLPFSLFAQREDEKLGDFFGSERSKKEKSLMSSFFTRKEKTPKKDKSPFLPDFYAKAVGKAAERNQLPSFFNQILQKEKERTQQPDFFSKGIFKTERQELSDHFSKPIFGRDRGMQSDHFSSEVDQKEHSEEEMYNKVRPRKQYRKNFVGERLRLFNTDPNKKQKRKDKKREKHKDPFGKDARELDQPQNPKGQMDLFGGGVLPKMKDLR